MIESIVSDIVGSIYEFHNISIKDFQFFQDRKKGMSYLDKHIKSVVTEFEGKFV